MKTHNTPSAPRTLDDYFLAATTQGDDEQTLVCQACDASSLVTNLFVPAAIGTTFIGVAVSCILPATQQRWLALGQWLHLQEETLIALNGKLGVLFLTGQTVGWDPHTSPNIAPVSPYPPLPSTPPPTPPIDFVRRREPREHRRCDGPSTDLRCYSQRNLVDDARPGRGFAWLGVPRPSLRGQAHDRNCQLCSGQHALRCRVGHRQRIGP